MPQARRGERPLVLSADRSLIDELIRACAVADLQPQIEADPAKAAESWRSARMVLVGEDVGELLVPMIAGGWIPRRGEVALVSRGPEDRSSVLRLVIALGASAIFVLPAQAVHVTEYLLALARAPDRESPVVAVIGGCGGAGASTLGVALMAAAMRRNQSVALLDADQLGGGLAALLTMNVWNRPWSVFSDAQGFLPAAAFIHSGEDVRPGSTVVSWEPERRIPVSSQAMSSVVMSARRTFDVVVVDLPRQVGAAGRMAVDRAMTLMVVPTEVAACAAAAHVSRQLRDVCPDVRLVVRRTGRRALAPEAIGEALELPVVSSFRSESSVVGAWNRGEPPGRHPGALSRCADRILGSLGNTR